MSPKKTPIINDFRSGELTPDLDVRVDLKDYYRGCRVLENALPLVEGGVAKVPGTYYVRPVKQLEEGWNIKITKSGDGTGIVASDVPGIDCGASCYCFFTAGSKVILTATPIGGGFVGWSGEGFSGTDPISVLMNGNKVINAEFSAIPKNPYLIGWYKFNEGSGAVAANSAIDGSLGGGLLPNQNVVNVDGGFWTNDIGFGHSRRRVADGKTGDFAWAALPAERTYDGGDQATWGMFVKVAICTIVVGLAFNLHRYNTDSFAIIFGTYNQSAGQRWFVANMTGVTYSQYLNVFNEWVFLFVGNDEIMRVVRADGTLGVATGALTMGSITVGFIHTGVKSNQVANSGIYPCNSSFGDLIIYNFNQLTLSEWASWYDTLRSRYGMAARSGW